MATELELCLFLEELESVQGLPEAQRWEVERDNTVPLGLFVTMHPISSPSDKYKARIRWLADYFGPFSLKFVNLQTGAENEATAWPVCTGFRPNSLDACLPITHEGQLLHPEWRGQFPNVELPMQHALLQLQCLLDNTYGGRGHR